MFVSVYIHTLPVSTASIAVYIGEAGVGYMASLLLTSLAGIV